MNLQGEFVDPLDWWDPHWLKDQVEVVWAKAGAPAPAAPSAGQEAKGKKKAGGAKKAKKKKN